MVVTESPGRSSLKVPAALAAVPFLTGGRATGVVWCSCQTAADGELSPSTPTVTRSLLALVLTMTISSGRAEANTSTPGSAEVAETIVVPEVAANLCFGGHHHNRLFICASTSVYAMDVGTRGVEL